MKKTYLLTYFLILFFIIGCATTDWKQLKSDCEKNAETWIGSTEHDLIKQFGVSKFERQSDGDGGFIITYLAYGKIDEYGGRKILYRSYYLDKNKKIYHTRCFIGS